MAIYAIGDVQGCYDELMQLLDYIEFEPSQDTLWFCGDIINRGPKSLATIRFIKQLNQRAITVLGNHDLHFLAVALLGNKASKHDTFSDILQANDRDELVDWLRQQKLFYHEKSLNLSMVHAGIPPDWSITDALRYSEEVEIELRRTDSLEFFQNMYGNQPRQWQDNLSTIDRCRYITNVFTRMRFCNEEGLPDFKHKGDIGTQPSHLMPWFMHPTRKTHLDPIVFGHWSTLTKTDGYNVFAIDTGCLWGGRLTALRIDDQSRTLLDINCKKRLKSF